MIVGQYKLLNRIQFLNDPNFEFLFLIVIKFHIYYKLLSSSELVFGLC